MRKSLKCFFLTAGISALISSAAPAQDSKGDVLDLRRSIVTALRNNYIVRVDELTASQAKDQVKYERGAFDPQLSAGAVHFRDGDGDTYSYGKGTYEYVALDGTTPTGTSYSVSTYSTRMQDYDTESARSSGVSVTVSQNLLRGFGLRANLAPVRIAAKNAAISEQQLQWDASYLIEQVQNAYFDIILAEQNARVAKESTDLAERLYQENKKRESVGSMAGSDIFQAQAELAARRENLFDAQRALGDAKNALRLLLAEDDANLLDMRVELAPLGPPEKVEVDARKDFAHALEMRPDYRQAVLGLERDQIDALRASNAALPNMAAFAQGEWSGSGANLGNSYSGVRSDGSPDFALGLTLSHSIPNQSLSSQKASARKQVRIGKITLRQLERQISVELDNGARRIGCDWDRLSTARESRELAEESLKAEQKLYDTGNSSTFVLLRLQTDLMNAQLRELSAENDYRKALVEYERLTGSLLADNYIVTPTRERLP